MILWICLGRRSWIRYIGEARLLEGETILLGFLRNTRGIGSYLPCFHILSCSLFACIRFIRLASDTSSANRTVTFEDPPASANYVSASVPVSWLNTEIMNVAFVKAVAPEAYPGGLSALTDTHRFGDAGPLGKHWAYKYVADLDGMSYSGRFMAFLASDSVPVKATVYEEYFSDWIQPWCVLLSSFFHSSCLILICGSGSTSSRCPRRTTKYTISTHTSPALRNLH